MIDGLLPDVAVDEPDFRGLAVLSDHDAAGVAALAVDLFEAPDLERKRQSVSFLFFFSLFF